MQSVLRGVSLFLLLVLVASGSSLEAMQAGGDKADKAEKDKKQAVDKLVSAGSMTGKVTQWDKDDRLVTLDVKLQVPDGIDDNAAEAIANKQAELIRLQASPAPRDANGLRERLKQVANIQRDIQTNQAKLIKFKEVNQKFAVQIAENASVRLLEVPPVFDDKGNVVKRTPAEMKELRGDTRLPGYKGEMGDIKMDQMIRISIARRTGKVDTSEKTEKKSDKADTGDDKPIKLDRSYQATLVVIGTSDDARRP